MSIADLSSLSLLRMNRSEYSLQRAADGLKADQVILVSEVAPYQATEIISDVARHFGLLESLELQATFASIRGHRQQVSRAFMSVNKRDNFQFVPAHSEGTSRLAMQLASFYCYNNTTDGGVTVLLNVDDESPEWGKLRETTLRLNLGGSTLTTQQQAMLKARSGVHIPDDLMQPEDELLGEVPSPIPGTQLYQALSPLRKVRSILAERDTYTYWDSVASADVDGGLGYAELLNSTGLLKTPAGTVDTATLDNALPRRIWKSGSNYPKLFKGAVSHKLIRGELVILNNLTWAHSATNWTPGSGERNVVAAFA